MRRILLTAFIVAGCVPIVCAEKAEKIDPRLATVRKAFVKPVNERHGDDRLIAACLADRLHTDTPIEPVKKGDADAVFKVKGEIPAWGTRWIIGALATPSAKLEVELPDGTRLWRGGANAWAPFGTSFEEMLSEEGIACVLADQLLKTLFDAMGQAREEK